MACNCGGSQQQAKQPPQQQPRRVAPQLGPGGDPNYFWPGPKRSSNSPPRKGDQKP